MTEIKPSISLAQPDLTGNEQKYVLDCLNTGWISSQGKYVDKFSQAFSRYIGTQYAECTSSGTSALHLALAALDIGEGDEVIVPDLTFGATANAVLHCGASPILVDIDSANWSVSPCSIEQAISQHTKAIIVVHLYGRPAEMKEIMAIAEKHNLKVIEDCAESLGAEYEGVKTGAIGHLGCFSFFANKVMTTGEGGMVTTNDPQLKERIQILRDHGMSKDKRYWHLYPGYNYRMTNIQAAIGLAQLEKIDVFLQQRATIADAYRDVLSTISCVEIHQKSAVVKEVTWLFCFQLMDNTHAVTRDELIAFLNNNSVEARRFFYPLHMQPVFYCSGDFSQSIELSERGICLPTYTQLMPAQITYIGELIKQKLSHAK